MLDRRKLADEVLASYRAARQAFTLAKERDLMKQAREATNKRVTIGGSNKITDPDIEASFRSDVWAAHDEALASIDKRLAKASREMSEPPTEEAARYIVSISGRKNLTRDEVDAALDRYKGHAVERAIYTAAAESGLRGYGGKTAVENDVDDLRTLYSDVDKAIQPSSFYGRSDGYHAFMEQAIDNFGNGAAFDALAGFVRG